MSQDVAGATFMAGQLKLLLKLLLKRILLIIFYLAGSSAPELATAVIGVFIAKVIFRIQASLFFPSEGM